MWPRKMIDIGFFDLLSGLTGCVLPERAAVRRTLESGFDSQSTTLACLSVRSAFDLLLTSLQLPRGSEVLMSAMTIPDMVEIVRHHGLVPVPLDLVSTTCGVSASQLTARISPQTRMVVIAHLFGIRLDLSALTRAAKDHGLIVVEDCAQAFAGPGFTGSPGVDVSLFSFGPIKSATALGGGIVRARNKETIARMRSLQSRYRRQSRTGFAKRIAKYGVMKLFSWPPLYRLLFAGLKQPDRFINSLARNFGGAELFERIRRRPSSALMRLMLRRWRNYDLRRLEQRTANGRRIASRLCASLEHAGHGATRNSFWVLPVVADQPIRLIDELRNNGIDATQGGSLHVLETEEHSAPVAARLLRRIVFIPVYPELNRRAVERLEQTIKLYEQAVDPADTCAA